MVEYVELYRDPLGLKPFYYHYDGNNIVRSTELRDILDKGVPKEIDEDVLYAYLTHQYVPGNRTLIKGIRKMLPAHRIILSDKGMEIDKYWNIEENIGDAGKGGWASALFDVLNMAVVSCVGNGKGIGVFLSGGLDSSIVTALAYMNLGVAFDVFSVEFETFSELRHARQVVEYFGLEKTYHELVITADMVADDIMDIAKSFDEPMGDAAGVNNYYLAREAQKYIKVALTGDACDEVFGGYPWHAINLKYAPLFGLPKSIKRLEEWVLSLVPNRGNLNTVGNRLHRLASVFYQPTFLDTQLYMESAMTKAELGKLTWLKTRDANTGFTKPLNITNRINEMLALDCLNLLPEKFFARTYGAIKSSGIEERVPFANQEVVDFAFMIPPKLKIGHGWGKYILRQAMAGLLPKEILYRKKQGFGTPLAHWFKNKRLKDIVIDRLEQGELIGRYFNRAPINDIIRDLMQNEISSYHVANAVWTIFALQLWYDNVVGGVK